jgi:hypothetical protein
MRQRSISQLSEAAVLMAAAVGVLVPSTAFGQRESLPVDLPNGPAKSGFDIRRFSSAGNGWFKTFYVTNTQPLQKALNDGKVAADIVLRRF